MPRTLPAALTTVMDAGIYEPYLRVVFSGGYTDSGAVTVQPLGYKLTALGATIKVDRTAADTGDISYFRIVRGAVINGTPSTISTIWFVSLEIEFDGRFMTITGEPLDRNYLSIAADSDYETVIETALTNSEGAIVPSYEGSAAWKAYQFYPTGKNVVLSPRKKIFTLLKQKYLIFTTEDGWDGANNNMFFFVATENRSTDYTVIDLLFTENTHQEVRKLISRDEANTIRSNGSATSLLHNLGFLHSTASLPTNTINDNVGSRSSKIPVHLKYRTGDKVTFPGDGTGLNGTTQRINVIEVLDLQSTPAWYMILETMVWYGSTEGGSLPSTIEAAAPYTPLATGNFDGTLSENDNNIQAAMETIDDHDHDADYSPTAHTHEVDQRADMFNDAEGNPADLGTAADGTSTYAARRDHVHANPPAGTYAPTCTAGVNVDSTSAVADFAYMRVGAAVIFSGNLNVDATTAGIQSTVRVSLPVASDLTSTGDLTGIGGIQGSDDVVIAQADTANNEASVIYTPAGTANTVIRILIMYIVK